MAITTQQELISLADNPERGIDQCINSIETAWFDRRVGLNSKTHPAVFCADLIIGTTYGFLSRVDDGIAKVFGAHARNIADLSKHMGDEEKVGLFGTPSNVTLLLGIQYEAFTALAKTVTATVGRSTVTYQMLLIPKDTEVTFNGFTFAIENGIEIRYRQATGFQVVYDDTTSNPVTPISDNILKRGQRNINGKNYLTIDVPARQLVCKVDEGITSNLSSGCRGTIAYSDNLYNVRAFLRRANSTTLVELPVAYNQDVFDQNAVTLSLDVDSTTKQFVYEIPDVYIVNGTGVGTINIYTYTTKGAMTKDLRDVPLAEAEVNYQDYRYGAGRLGPYSEGIRNSGGIAWGVKDVTTGGSAPPTFVEIKESFLQGRRVRSLPVTDSNLVGTVQTYGYGAVKAIDYLTGRQYAVTKELQQQANKKFFAPMSCFVGSYLGSANDLVASGVVLDNGKRITIPHNVLFNVTDYTTQLVNQMTKNAYAGYTGEQLVELIATQTLVYLPFYYVLDTTNNQAVLRTYHLDAPAFKHQTFIAENSALGIEVGIGSIDIEHQDDGYLITIVTESTQSYKELDNDSLNMQLSINIVDSSTLANMKATLYGMTEDGERIWQFKLDTRFDVDVNDILYFNNFSMYGNVQNSVGSALNLDMTFLFLFQGDPRLTDTASDAKIDQSLYANTQVALIETSYNVVLGSRLQNLYSRVRPLVGEAQYQKYTVDVPDVYTEDKLKRDDEGFLVLDDNGDVIVEHRAGEPMKNSQGFPVYKYAKGDYVKDENNKYVQLAPRDLKYHLDFIGFDGAYYFSSDDYDAEFAKETKDYFVDVISKDLAFFSSVSLDRTGLFFQPRSKIGSKQVIINSNFQSYLKQDLQFVVIYYLDQSGYKNANLKQSLLDTTPQVLNEILLDATTISTAEIIEALRQHAPAEVKGINLNALAGDSTVDIISNDNDLTGFSIRKVLRLSSDRLVSVQEAIDVSFMPHDRNMVVLKQN